jgi:hypothetical protein
VGLLDFLFKKKIKKKRPEFLDKECMVINEPAPVNTPARRLRSYGYSEANGLSVRWADNPEKEIYDIEPKQPNDFLDSPELYFIMRYLPKRSEGMTLKIDDISYTISKKQIFQNDPQHE